MPAPRPAWPPRLRSAKGLPDGRAGPASAPPCRARGDGFSKAFPAKPRSPKPRPTPWLPWSACDHACRSSWGMVMLGKWRFVNFAGGDEPSDTPTESSQPALAPAAEAVAPAAEAVAPAAEAVASGADAAGSLAPPPPDPETPAEPPSADADEPPALDPPAEPA